MCAVRLVPETVVRPQGDRRLCDCPSVERARRAVARGRVRRREVGDDRAGGQDSGRHVSEGPVVVAAVQGMNRLVFQCSCSDTYYQLILYISKESIDGQGSQS